MLANADFLFQSSQVKITISKQISNLEILGLKNENLFNITAFIKKKKNCAQLYENNRGEWG